MPKLTEVLSKARLRRWDDHKDLDIYRQLLPARLKDTVSTEGGSKKCIFTFYLLSLNCGVKFNTKIYVFDII